MVEHAYIHIPFCIRKCNYCAFVSGININKKKIYIEALLSEIEAKYKGERLKTIYLGGGTPSLLNYADIKKILSRFNYDSNCEITLEVNPETVEQDKFLELNKLGINRISLGVQTFDNNLLKIIGRNHDENTIFNSIEIIKKTGFKNIGMDLIYGLPNQTIELFKSDLKKAISLNIQHLSTYGLKIEEDSYFGKNPPADLPDDEVQAKMFLFLCDFMTKNGFEHYEISNFAKKGFESKHNICYWQNKNYYGFGLNASGFENNVRYKNISDFDNYIKTPTVRYEEIFLTKQENMENEFFLALRLKNGINTKTINEKYNINFEKTYANVIQKYTRLNLLEFNNDNLKLTKEGILLSNEIMSDFISI